jgi:hypothetical protein
MRNVDKKEIDKIFAKCKRDPITGQMLPAGATEPRPPKPPKEKIKARDVLRQALKQPTPDPRLSEIAYHFVHMAGDAQGFAKILWKEYEAAPAGGIVKQRILDMVLRCLKIANDQDPKGSQDMGLLTEAELDAELNRALNETGAA